MTRASFADLTPEQRRAISSLGGKSVPPEKRTFSANKSLAIKAGRKGGQVTKAKRKGA